MANHALRVLDNAPELSLDEARELLGTATSIRRGTRFTVIKYLSQPMAAHWHDEPRFRICAGMPYQCLVKGIHHIRPTAVAVAEVLYLPEVEVKWETRTIVWLPKQLMRQLQRWPWGVFTKQGVGLETSYDKEI